MGRDCYSLPDELKGRKIRKKYEVEKDEILRKFDDRKSATPEEKVLYSKEMVKAVLGRYKRCAVSCSFGKDSMVVLHIVKEFQPDIKVVFANTGVEHKETLKFRDRMVEEWKLNYYEVVPEKGFWECVDEYGLPDFRSHGGTPKCCGWLKEKPLKDFYKKHFIRAIFLGITYDESWTRRQVMIQYGDVYETGEGLVKVHPLAFWTTGEVFEYCELEGIPLNPVYEKVERCGCMPCTGHLGWIEQVQKTHPALYAKLQHLKGQSLVSDW